MPYQISDAPDESALRTSRVLAIEPPGISADPSADNLDLHAFVSPDAHTTVTAVATFVPFGDPAGGHNFFAFDDDVRYTIYIDGNASEDITYHFDFESETRNSNTFLYNVGLFSSTGDANLNVHQTYMVTRVDDFGTSGLDVAPINVGPSSVPDYTSLGEAAVHDLGNGARVFAGPRDYPFFLDLGAISTSSQFGLARRITQAAESTTWRG